MRVEKPAEKRLEGSDVMGKTLRRIRRGGEMTALPVRQAELEEAWNRGFHAGAKRQNELDTKLMLEWLGKIEEIPGIGEKTAWKIREHFLEFMRERRERNDLHLASPENT